MKITKTELLALIFFLFFWIIFFRKLFFGGMVPIPGNLLVWFFSPWKEVQWAEYPGGVYKQGVFGFDTIRQMYPWRLFTTGEIFSGKLPLWNPYQFSGAPHLANFQTAVFYPLSIVYYFLPQIWAWTILIIIQPVMAGIFMYLYLKQLKISLFGRFTGSFIWAFCLPMSAWLIWNIYGHQFAFLPLVLYLVEKFKQTGKRKFLIWQIFVLAITLLAGHPQIFLYIFIFSGIYFFYQTKKIMPWVLIGAVTALLTAVAWFPLAQYYSLASRDILSSEFNFLKTLLPWENLLTIFAPDFLGNPTTANYWGSHDYIETAFYVGSVGLLFALIALTDKQKIKKYLFFAISAIIALALCLNWFLPRALYLLKIPVYTTTVATRFLFLFSFSLSVLAAAGAEKIQKQGKIPKVLFLLLFLYLIILSLSLVLPKIFPGDLRFVNIPVFKRNLYLPFGVLIASTGIIFLSFKIKKIKNLLLYSLFLLMALDLFYVANKIIPFTYKSLVFPDVPLLEFLKKRNDYYRFAGSSGSNIESNFASYYGFYSTEGYDTLYPRYYGEIVWSAENSVFQEDISRTTVVFPTTGSKGQRKLEDFLGVKYILEKDDDYQSNWDPSLDKFPEDHYQLVWQEKNWKVYENKKVYPRAFLVNNYTVISDKTDSVNTFYNDDFDPLKSVILSDNPGDLKTSEGEGNVEIISYQPGEIYLKTESDFDKILVLADTYYPGWEVYIDGSKDKIYKANHAFRAVFLPPGSHEVIFAYQPKVFKIGLIISIISFGGLVIYEIIRRHTRI